MNYLFDFGVGQNRRAFIDQCFFVSGGKLMASDRDLVFDHLFDSKIFFHVDAFRAMTQERQAYVIVIDISWTN